MVNLTFYRLDSSYPIIFWQFRSTSSSISIYISLQRDDHSCWNFFFDLLRIILFGAFQMHLYFWSSAVRISYSKIDLRFHCSWGKISSLSKILDHDPICWMLWYHDGFFQTTAGVRSDRGHLIYWTYQVLLIDPADSVYFCAFVLFWLEIRLITICSICFW